MGEILSLWHGLATSASLSASSRRLGRLFRCGLFPFDRQQHFPLACGGLARLLALRGYRFARQTFLQGVHEVDNILALRTGLSRNRLTVAFSVDKFGQRFFVVVLKFLRLELGRLLIDDMFR
jgi:hypothetical protein